MVKLRWVVSSSCEAGRVPVLVVLIVGCIRLLGTWNGCFSAALEALRVESYLANILDQSCVQLVGAEMT